MSCRQEGLLTCCLVKQLEKQSKPMLFRLQNAANSLTSPTMTVPFDTDDCATIPRVGYQPVGPHTAHGGPRLRFCGTVASVESGQLGHGATAFVLPRKGRPTAWPGLPPGATKVRPRSRPATRKKNYFGPARGSGNRADSSFIIIGPSTPRMVPYALMPPVVALPVRASFFLRERRQTEQAKNSVNSGVLRM